MSRLPPAPAVALLPVPMAVAIVEAGAQPDRWRCCRCRRRLRTEVPRQPAVGGAAGAVGECEVKVRAQPGVGDATGAVGEREVAEAAWRWRWRRCRWRSRCSRSQRWRWRCCPTVENKSIPLMEICISSGDAASAGTDETTQHLVDPRKRIGRRVGRGDLRGGGQRRPDAQSDCQHAQSTDTNRRVSSVFLSRGCTRGWPQLPLKRGPPMTRNLLRARPPHACLTQVELRGFVHC